MLRCNLITALRTTVVPMSALLISGTAAMAQDGNWVLEPRTLKTPAAASEQLQTGLRTIPQPDVAANRQAPQNRQEWEALIEQRKAAAPSLEDQEQLYGASIVPDSIAGVSIFRVSPPKATTGRIFLHLHGGAYVFRGGNEAVDEGAEVAVAAGLEAISVDYRMPPEHPYPAAVDDAIAVYREILKQYEPGQIAIGGTSAGGGLTLAALMQMKALGLALPAVAYLGTPWADLTDSSDTLHTNEGIDRVLVTYYGWLRAAALLYAGEYPLTHPRISPLYGDFSDLPPTILVTGTRDMLLSDSARVHRKLRDAGIVAELHVFEGLSHADYLIERGSPEYQSTLTEVSAFFTRYLE